MYRVGLSALAQPRLTEGDQPYPLHSLSTGQLVNLPRLIQVRVRVPNLAPEPDNPYPKPEARDLTPKSLSLVLLHFLSTGQLINGSTCLCLFSGDG